MAAMTVYGKLLGPAAAALPQSALTATLVDYTNEPVIGFDTVDKTEIVSQLPVSVNADGTWTQALLPNAQLRLAGGTAATAWRITEGGAGASFTYWIVVVAGNPAVPVWVGDLVTTLVGGAAYPTPVNLALGGNLTVAGTFTYDGIAIAAPPNDPAKFLSGDGTWRVGGGAVSSVNTKVGVVVLNSVDVGAIPTTAAGAAGGVATLDGSGLLTAAQFPTGLVRAVHLDQMAAPTADVAMGSHKLTGLAPGVASTDAATIGQLPVARDRRSAMLGLMGQPFDYDDINDIGLGLTSGFLVLMLIEPDAGQAAAVNLLLGAAGSGTTGPANVCAFTADGSSRVALSGDVSAQLSNAANNNTVLRLPFGSSFAVDGQTAYWFGAFCQMSSNPTIGGVFASLHLPAVNGHRPGIVIGGLSSVPSSIDPVAANAAGASYWFGVSP